MVEYKETSQSYDERVTMTSNPLLTAMVDVNRTLLQQAMSVNKEWNDFLHRRVKDNVATSQALISANSARDMVEIWSRYVQAAGEDCREQFNSMIQWNATSDEKPERGRRSRLRDDEE
jgi:hypothetical protein